MEKQDFQVPSDNECKRVYTIFDQCWINSWDLGVAVQDLDHLVGFIKEICQAIYAQSDIDGSLIESMANEHTTLTVQRISVS